MIEAWDEARCASCNRPLGASVFTIWGVNVDDESEKSLYDLCLSCASLYDQRADEALEAILKSMVKRKDDK